MDFTILMRLAMKSIPYISSNLFYFYFYVLILFQLQIKNQTSFLNYFTFNLSNLTTKPTVLNVLHSLIDLPYKD
jgi:hypothetical protein